MDKLKLQLSAAEWEIMLVVWRHDGAVTVRKVLEEAYPAGEKAYTTVQTLMNILADKGILRREKTGQVIFYRKAITKERFLKRSLATFARNMFGGSYGAMASFLVNTAPLTEEELRALRALLDRTGGTKK